MRKFVTALALLGAVAVGITGCSGTPQPPQATPTTASRGAPTPSSAPAAASRQIVLPLTGLENPQDVAVDAAGNVYVADLHQGKDDKGFPDATTRVIKLAAGSDSQTVLPQFVHAHLMSAPAGAVWVADAGNEQLVKLAVGPESQIVLPFPDLGMHGEIQAVDAAGNAYGANGGGVDPNGACCLAVHVVELAAGSDTPTVLPFKNVHRIVGVAVDSSGSVYVVDADHDRVLKLAAGSDTPTVLPFEGIKKPIRMTVDTAGNVYLIDGGNRRVLRLAAEGS